jgi:hypothetical protein
MNDKIFEDAVRAAAIELGPRDALVWNEAISAACDVIRKATREFKRRSVREALEEVYNDVRGLKR